MWVEYWRLAARDAELARDCREIQSLWLKVAEGAIAEGIATGTFRTDRTPAEAAYELHALLDGLGIRFSREHTQSEALDAIAIAEMAARRLLMN